MGREQQNNVFKLQKVKRKHDMEPRTRGINLEHVTVIKHGTYMVYACVCEDLGTFSQGHNQLCIPAMY